ncbi:ALS2 C-terminal-like protein isoform X2 [Prinia subflava]|uniref:ALS2 C-terminal-like protein isoform X2 n=1 Tax=Prinia subflava TaxID=208062 RepID=UPI002FDFC0F7
MGIPERKNWEFLEEIWEILAASVSGISGSLLRLEENFSSCLARLDGRVLQPLLQAAARDARSRERRELLAALAGRLHALQEFCHENLGMLRESCHENLGMLRESCQENVGMLQESCQENAGMLRESCQEKAGMPQESCQKNAGMLRESCQEKAGMPRECCREKAGMPRECCREKAGMQREFHTLGKGERLLGLHLQYFVTLANFVVMQGFEQAANSKSDAWGPQGAALPEFLRDLPSEGSLARALLAAFQEPFQAHVRSHRRLLARLQELLHEESQREAVAAVEREFGKLESFICQVMDEAAGTKELWKSLGAKFTDVLCVPERRLLEDSRNLPIATGTARSERLLLFDDVLVLIQGNSFRSFDLKLVWVDENCGEKSAPGLHSLRITTPEETFVLSAKDAQTKAAWRWKLEQAARQALNGKRDFPLWGRSGEGGPAPARRFFSYAFRTEGRLRGATYEGEWLWGKPHGKGTLKWRDGRNHVGDFQEGLEHGFGIRLVPRRSEDRYDCYKCHWYQGKMRGYGICEYGNDVVYKGYFKDDARHGFGILEDFSARHPFKYTGNWERDKKSGYGVWEDKERGERYLGMWRDDHRHGEGIVVTQAGLCYQRTFQAGKAVGSGILLLEDGACDGNCTEEPGKGTPGTHCGHHMQLDLKEFPVEQRWPGIFQQFQEFLSSGCKEETEEAFLGFHVQSSKELRRSQEYLYCQRGAEEISWRSEEVPEEPQELRGYLEKALGSSLHPLGKLQRALAAAFQASYGGGGANRHLLPMAQLEVKFYAGKIWEFFQGLWRLVREQRGRAEPEDAEPSSQQGSSLVLPLILPCFYPELSMLYMLRHQREDSRYCQAIVELSLLPDLQLLEFLDVQKHLWPLKDLTLTSNQRRSLIKDKCFLSATECLQKLIATADPGEKLAALRRALAELELSACRALGRHCRLPMDDLLPLLVFVVARARIQHLGAEIHLIRDLMDPTNQGGMLDFLLTALESCYEHIQRIRLQPKENSSSS